jgi:hypothetical protein
VLVVREGGSDTGASLPPLQEVEERAGGTVESSRAGSRLEAGRCRHVQISELFSLDMCDQVVMDSWRPRKSESSHAAEQSRAYATVFRFVSFPSVSSATIRLSLFPLFKGKIKGIGEEKER